jgi:4-hydroxy-tetrahydrodipicolinate synthase
VPYNIQGRTAINVTPATMARIAQFPEVVAVKEASGNITQMAEVVRLCGDKINVLSGDDGMVLPLLAIGGKGVISVVNNLVPRRMTDLLAAWNAGDAKLARERFYEMLPLCNAMFVETNPIPIKTAMALAGLIPSDEMRLPMCPLLPENLEKLKKVLAGYGLLK